MTNICDKAPPSQFCFSKAGKHLYTDFGAFIQMCMSALHMARQECIQEKQMKLRLQFGGKQVDGEVCR